MVFDKMSALILINKWMLALLVFFWGGGVEWNIEMHYAGSTVPFR